MASVQWTYSQNYMWKRSSFLGKGSYAVAYKGFHTATGDAVAIKCFLKPDLRGMKKFDLQRLKEAERKQLKELELLSELDHENIIKLIGNETETITRDRVSIMELCEGGSLHSILQDPENKYGINEEEFLLLLKHSTAGLKYLRDRNVSHRDIKPGNILLYCTEDGRHIYKLADFDTARVILENQSFQTLCGTEEYLCPYMFTRGLVEDVEAEKRDFSPMVDLWSLGCTFYHAATGTVPFRPFKKGPVDRRGMYNIHKNKPAGVIAAIEDEHGTVDWRTDLPNTCLLSSGLQDLVVCLLQKLLTKEADLSFKDYFIEVDKILSRQPVHIFDVQKCKSHVFYLDSNASLGNLRIQIRNKMCVKVEEQILVQKGTSLEKLDSSSLVCDVIKETNPANPVFLLPSSQMNFELSQVGHTDVRFSRFEKMGGPRSDAFVAELCTSEAYVVARHVENLAQCFNCLMDVPAAAMSVMMREVEQLSEVLQKSIERLHAMECILKSQEKQTSTVTEFVPLLGLNQHVDTHDLSNIITKNKTVLISIQQLLHDMQDEIAILQKRYGPENKNNGYKFPLDVQETQMLIRSKEKAHNYVKIIRSLWKNLSEYSSEDGELLKIKVKRTCDKLQVLHRHCSSTLQNVIRSLHPWFSKFQQDLQACKSLRLRLNCGVREIQNFEASLKETEDKCERLFSDIVSKAKNVKEVKPADMLKTPRITSSILLEGLQNARQSQQNLKTVLDENGSLIERCLLFSKQICQYSNNNETSAIQGNIKESTYSVLQIDGVHDEGTSL